MPREIGQLALVAAVNAARWNSTGGAGSLAPANCGDDKQAPGLCNDALDSKLVQRRKKRNNPGSLHDRNTASTTMED